jgi:hypothetical protein
LHTPDITRRISSSPEAHRACLGDRDSCKIISRVKRASQCHVAAAFCQFATGCENLAPNPVRSVKRIQHRTAFRAGSLPNTSRRKRTLRSRASAQKRSGGIASPYKARPPRSSRASNSLVRWRADRCSSPSETRAENRPIVTLLPMLSHKCVSPHDAPSLPAPATLRFIAALPSRLAERGGSARLRYALFGSSSAWVTLPRKVLSRG